MEIAAPPTGDLGIATLAARLHISERTLHAFSAKKPDSRPLNSCW
ncbi:hypothetical protein [Burkholderia sp. BE17]|nr:hypothetical protein [Burkholderia sp. BE17]